MELATVQNIRPSFAHHLSQTTQNSCFYDLRAIQRRPPIQISESGQRKSCRPSLIDAAIEQPIHPRCRGSAWSGAAVASTVSAAIVYSRSSREYVSVSRRRSLRKRYFRGQLVGLCAAASERILSELEKQQMSSPPSVVELFNRAVTFYSRSTALLMSYIPVFIDSKLLDLKDPNPPPDHEVFARWHRLHEEGAVDIRNLINELNGFYVKCGQVIATRSDLFPKEYSEELSHMVDSVNPFPFEYVKRVVEEKLLGGLPLDEVFESFDIEPLGSASIAQVHRATLRGGRVIAVKVQRPYVEPRLISDIGVITSFSYITRGLFPLDYYVVFKEIGDQLVEEFDFVQEANSMDRIGDALSRGGRNPPVSIPKSIPGLSCKEVLCMDFVPGVPLSQLKAELTRRGIEVEEGSRAERVFGKKLLKSLTKAFAVMIFEEGFFHADPHPGNIFIKPDGSVALIDFGQTKRIGYSFRKQLAELVVQINKGDALKVDLSSSEYAQYARMAESMGVVFSPNARPSCAAALAFWLIDTSRSELPGGYESSELSPNCPVRDIASFPRDFVLVCRTTLLIRGLAMRLGLTWSLAQAWNEAATALLTEGVAATSPKQPASSPAGQSFWRLPLDLWRSR